MCRVVATAGSLLHSSARCDFPGDFSADCTWKSISTGWYDPLLDKLNAMPLMTESYVEHAIQHTAIALIYSTAVLAQGSTSFSLQVNVSRDLRVCPDI